MFGWGDTVMAPCAGAAASATPAAPARRMTGVLMRAEPLSASGRLRGRRYAAGRRGGSAGDAGILEHRGYPIEELAQHSMYLEVAYLLIKGELPTEQQLTDWTHQVNRHRLIHENIRDIIGAFRYDAHPMAKLMASVASLMTFYPSSRRITDPASRELNAFRLLGKMPTL